MSTTNGLGSCVVPSVKFHRSGSISVPSSARIFLKLNAQRRFMAFMLMACSASAIPGQALCCQM